MMSRVHLSGRRGGAEAPAAGRGAPGRAAVRLAALALAPLLAACGEDHVRTYPQTTFAPTTEYARITDDLFHLTLWLGVAVGIIVFALVAYILVRFRHRPGAPEPKQIAGNTTLELAWTLVPAVILAVIAVPTVRAIVATQPAVPSDALVVEAIGKQWWWEFRYTLPNGDTVVTANEIHVPTDRTVAIKLLSDNVLHSFWVPQMGGKRDMIPNRTNWLVFKPEVPGVYLGQCAEFCGDSHALMRMRLIAHEPAGFDAWLASENAPARPPADSTSAVAVGKQLFNQVGCVACHAIEGHEGAVGRLGPNLTHVGRRRTIAGGILENNAENLQRWIYAPTEVKPGSLMPNNGWTEEQTRYIVAYLQSLQ